MEVTCVGSQLAYPCQCYWVTKCESNKRIHDCTVCLKWVDRVLVPDLDEGKQRYNEKGQSSMDCGGGTKLLLTATNRRKTWNCLILHAILVNLQLTSEQKVYPWYSICQQKILLVIRLMLIFYLEVQVKLFAKSFNFVSKTLYKILRSPIMME